MSVSSELEQLVASGEFARMVGRQPASAKAYSGGSTTFTIGNVARSVGRASLGPTGANITVSATSFSALSTPLTLEVDLTGRPLRICLTGLFVAGAGGALMVDVNLRGVPVTGVSNGLIYTSTTTALTLTGEETVMSPEPGPAVLEVVAKRTVADGTVFIGSGERLALTAMEM